MNMLGIFLALSLVSPGLSLASSPVNGRDSQAFQPSAGTASGARPLKEVVQDNLGYVPNQVMVKVADQASQAEKSAFAEAMFCFQLSKGVEVLPGVYKLSAPAGSGLDVSQAVSALRASGAVQYAEPNYLFYATNTPNDEQYKAGQQWGVTQVKAEQAWDITTGSDQIKIAILDTGTATDHPDLRDKIVPGYNFVSNNSNPYDDEGHGTYTAGIAAASSNNGTGVVGMSWGARIMPVKVLSSQGSGSDEDIALGIRWATDNGARIISASLGGSEDTAVMRDAAKYAADHNVLLVAAAGNSPDGKNNYPAAYDGVLAVGATGRSDTYTGFSSYGQYVDVTAPGVGILSTGWAKGTLDYEYANGTSAACPFVSGVAALVLSVNPSLTAQQVRWIIDNSSDDFGDPGWDVHYGYGRLNAAKAVQLAQQGAPKPPPAKPTPQPNATPSPAATTVVGQPASVQINTNDVSPGKLLAITGANFGPNELISIALSTADGKSRDLGSAQSDSKGAFKAEVALPASIASGNATLVVTGSKSQLRATANLTISQAPSNAQSVIKGTVRGATGPATVKLKPSIGVSGPDITVQTDANGAYIFNNLQAGIYSLSASASGSLPAGPFSVQLDGSAGDVKVLDVTIAATRPAAFDRVAPVAPTGTLLSFPPVGHTLRGPFLKFWQAHGGLAVFGYPISEEFQEASATDGKQYTVQYFERNRFEYHPEFAGTTNEVLMGLLGVDTTRGRTFPAGVSFTSTATSSYFNQTQHSLSGPFLKYWQQHGGLAIFGYPISEELMENGYLVQYFERNRFEYHPEFVGTPNEVLLGLLGVEVARRNGWVTP